MPATNYLDISEIIETFDPDETRSLISAQIDLLDNDACEIMTDNFKMLYTRYAALKRDRETLNGDLFVEAETRFFNICEIFIEEVSKKFGFTVGEEFINENYQSIPSIALPIYLFFVIDFRSNIFNTLLSFISSNRDQIADAFSDRAQKHDAITSVNKSMDDQVTALIASNIYDVIDWCLDQFDSAIFFEHMEHGYAAYEPVKNMCDSGAILDPENFVDSIRDIIKHNISLKARIGFDLICRIKGYKL